MSVVVGLMGKKRSGKDTVAKFLVENHGFVRVAFADPLKDALLKLNPYVADGVRLADAVNMADWDVAKEAYPEIRRLLQVFGAEVGRGVFSEDIWINFADSAIYDAREKNVVITDVRFPNEADYIRGECGGQLWRIERPGFDLPDTHVSENAWLDIEPDGVIYNNTLKGLEASAETLAQIVTKGGKA